MTPGKIVRRSLEAGLAIIALTDHNSAENTPARAAAAAGPGLRVTFARPPGAAPPPNPALTHHTRAHTPPPRAPAAAGTGLLVVPGIEISTAEEVHVLGLFESCGDAMKMQELVFEHLAPGTNDEHLFGIQVIANEHDEVEGFNTRLLVASTSLDVDRTVESIHRLNGLAVFSHIDRGSYSILSQLGFIPAGIGIDGIEISKRTAMDEARIRYGHYGPFPMLRASDAHALDDIGTAHTAFLLERPAFPEIAMALAGREGRRIAGHHP